MMALRRFRHRGSVYVAVLAASVIIGTIGLSALLGVRIQHRAAGVTEDAVKARFYAQSMVDVAMFTIANDPNWRADPHDEWLPKLMIDAAACSFKLVDEQDGDLTDDWTEPVRLYSMATVGDAVRIYSVLLEQTDVAGGNLLSNGAMENGTTDWTGADFGFGQCDLESSTDEPHSGNACIWVKNRGVNTAGPSQEISAKLTGGASYYTEVWLKTKDFSETFLIVIYTDSTGFGGNFVMLTSPTVTTEWTKVSGTLTPVWSGTLIEARWFIASMSTNQEFMIDDAVLVEGTKAPTTGNALRVIPGTWRQEVLPSFK